MIINERVRADLRLKTRFGDVRLMDVTDSTNRVLTEAAEAGCPEGAVVVADVQTLGRGRLDRRWETKPGEALLVSVLLRPTGLARPRWHLLTAAAALAALDCCLDLGVRPQIKWPNDLMIGNRKLAGILAEASPGVAVVGMGLNIKGGPPGAAFLEEITAAPVDGADLLVDWLFRLDHLLRDWDEVATRYRSECASVGRQVNVVTASVTYDAVTVESIDEDGRLVITTADGPVAISVGDIEHLRPASGNW